MSQPHAKPAKELTKKHGDPLGSALDAKDTPETRHPEQLPDAVPPPQDGGHSHSAAAHLDLGGTEHTKPVGNLRHGADPGALRQPPMVVQRVGKQHRD